MPGSVMVTLVTEPSAMVAVAGGPGAAAAGEGDGRRGGEAAAAVGTTALPTVKIGLMSKTRLRWLPSTVTAPPLVFWMVRLPPAGRMANSPAALSTSPAVPRRVIS